MSEHPAIRMRQHLKDCPPDKWDSFYSTDSYIQYHMKVMNVSKQDLKSFRDRLALWIKIDPDLRINYKNYVLPKRP
jgi:hypothetical protein